MELQGAVALVTGGGRRIGRAVTEALAEAGARIVIHYRSSRQEAEATAASLAEKEVESQCVAADLSRPADIESLFEQIDRRFGRLDVLVNSAASFERQPLQEITVGDWDAVLAVNLRAPFLCIQRAVPLLRSAGRPGQSPALVVNVADLSGEFPWPGFSHHGASKAALLHLTRIAARELAPGIRVNAVVPGPVLPPPGSASDDPEWLALCRRLPSGGPGRPSQVGEAVVFLAHNDFVVGEAIHVDGGEHLLGGGHRRL